MRLRPNNKQELKGFISSAFGVKIPGRVFTKGHSSPMDFIWDAWSNPGADVAAWASRSGIKTLGASILAALEFLFAEKPIQARVLAGSEDQAANLYGYWADWCAKVLPDLVDGDPARTKTKLKNGLFEILPASQKRVRGPKVQRLYEDELDEIPLEVDTAAVGMLASRTGRPARTVYTSTWQYVDGAMARLVGGSPDNGVRVHRWNIWESMAKCPDERHQFGAGCAECGLSDACIAKAREYYDDPRRCIGIGADCEGLYQINEIIKAYRKVGQVTWDAEYLCLRPSVEGLVYPAFDPMRHGVRDVPDGLTLYRVIDWGYGAFVCLWIGTDKTTGRMYVLDTYIAEEGTLAQHATYIKNHPMQEIRATFCDPAGRNKNDQTGRSNIEQFRAEGIVCEYTMNPRAREVKNGIRLVRDAFDPARGDPVAYFVQNENNKSFILSMQSYRNRKINDIWIDEPQDPQKHEHIPDAFRYFVVNWYARRGMLEPDPPKEKAPQFSSEWFDQQVPKKTSHAWQR
jgi:hypothetical protein